MAEAEDLKEPPRPEGTDAQNPRRAAGAPAEAFPSSVGWI